MPQDKITLRHISPARVSNPVRDLWHRSAPVVLPCGFLEEDPVGKDPWLAFEFAQFKMLSRGS